MSFDNVSEWVKKRKRQVTESEFIALSALYMSVFVFYSNYIEIDRICYADAKLPS